MTFLPIVGRELRVASRKKSTYLTRLSAVFIALVIGVLVFCVVHASTPPYVIGTGLFVALSILSFIYSIAVGILVTSDCLSVEKREGTLGLLFLTDLRGYDVVFGKLVATSLNAFYGMLAIFPVLAVPILLGGVTLNELARVMIVCVNLMFFSLAAGMFASATCQEDRKAMGLTILIILGVSAIPPLFGLYSFARQNWNTFPEAYLVPSPVVDCIFAFASRLGMKVDYFWTKVALTHGYGWLFLILSCFIVPRSWQESSTSRRVSSWQRFIKWIAEGSREKRNILRRNLLDTNAFYWLAGRGRGKIVMMWSLLSILILAWLWCWGVFGKDWLNKFNFVTSSLVLHMIVKYYLATESCRRFVEDRRTGALELLLSTPITVEEILRGQRLALLRIFSAPVLAVILIDLLFLIAGFNERNSYSSRDETFWVTIYLILIAVFILDLIAISWVGMWRGMRSRGANRATAGILARVVLLRWVVFVLTLLIFVWLSLFRSMNNEEYVFIFTWFIISVGINLCFMLPAKNNLYTRFRYIAAQRFEFKKPKTAPPPIPSHPDSEPKPAS